ncbi:hypothetical protein GOBAR_AA04697 [Gossypium barbadense]|uniref:Uncharacterized protein n=1 Tax=Gossypium barbadense TaxID=3634 RepID=A0A2P5YJY7_GOSBA|nr:hypothetical protein GOBAR_AA04697 [Gossypium barbadense]
MTLSISEVRAAIGNQTDFKHFDDYTRRDDVLPTTSIDEGTSNKIDVGESENNEGTESDADPIQEVFKLHGNPELDKLELKELLHQNLSELERGFSLGPIKMKIMVLVCSLNEVEEKNHGSSCC